MKMLPVAYCDNCGNLKDYTVSNETIEEDFHGKHITYKFDVGRCKVCGSEVATSLEYNYAKSEAKWAAYRMLSGRDCNKCEHYGYDDNHTYKSCTIWECDKA